MREKILQGIITLTTFLLVALGMTVSNEQEIFADEIIKITMTDIMSCESNDYINISETDEDGSYIATFKAGTYELDVASEKNENYAVTEYIITEGVSLTINDTSADKTGKMSGHLTVEAGGEMIINGGVFEGIINSGKLTINGGKIYGYEGIVNSGTLTINGGEIYGTKGIVNSGILTINDGKISAGSDLLGGIGILCKAGKLIINGGMIEGHSYAIEYMQGTQVNINAGIFRGVYEWYEGHSIIVSWWETEEKANSISIFSIINPTSILSTELSEVAEYGFNENNKDYSYYDALYAKTDTLIVTANKEENGTSNESTENNVLDETESGSEKDSTDNIAPEITLDSGTTSNTVQKDVSSPQTGDNFTYVMVVALLATIIIITIGKRKKVRC